MVDEKGKIVETNAAARALLAHRRADVVAALRAAVAGRPATLGFLLTPLRDHGAPSLWLAILRADSPDARISASISSAATRWSLTPRQTEILAHVVRGVANATIAAELGVSGRAVELHVTALFDRAGVDSRVGLVSSVLLGPR